jgi:cytochrome c
MNRRLLLLALLTLLPAPYANATGPAPKKTANQLTGDARTGEARFKTCASCHQVGPYARGAYGPQLNGIIGRAAGATTDFKYSDAMKNSHIVWTEAMLAAYLRAPHDVVPGTSMRFWGIGDEQQIADLLAYLRGAR